MTPKQLRIFAAVAQSLSFARASEVLHLTQPALSVAIRNLEDALGGRLLTRTTRHVRLTPEGAALLPQALQLLADWDGVRDRFRGRFALRSGHVTLAAMPSFASNVLPQALREFRDRHPNVEITVEDVIHEQVVDLVDTGRVELGFCFEPDARPTLAFETLFVDRFVAIVPRQLPVGKSGSIRWSQLLQREFVALQRPSSMRHAIEQELAREGIELRVAFECHQLATVGRLVAEGLGVSVVPALCEPQMTALGVRCLKLSEPYVRRAVGLLSRRDRELSAAAEGLRESVRRTAIPRGGRRKNS